MIRYNSYSECSVYNWNTSHLIPFQHRLHCLTLLQVAMDPISFFPSFTSLCFLVLVLVLFKVWGSSFVVLVLILWASAAWPFTFAITFASFSFTFPLTFSHFSSAFLSLSSPFAWAFALHSTTFFSFTCSFASLSASFAAHLALPASCFSIAVCCCTLAAKGVTGSGMTTFCCFLMGIWHYSLSEYLLSSKSRPGG